MLKKNCKQKNTKLIFGVKKDFARNFSSKTDCYTKMREVYKFTEDS